MRLYSAFLLLLVAACGGAAPSAPVAPSAPSPAPVAVPVAPVAPVAVTAPAPPPRPTDAEGAAKAFFDALARHDADAAARVADDDFARGQTRVYADVTDVQIVGVGKPELWPHLEDHVLYEATFARKKRADRIVVAVSNDPRRGWRVVGLRNLTEMAEEAAAATPARTERTESKGKLLTKPIKGACQIELGSDQPTVGEKADLYRMVDKSIPFVGGSWVLIAEAQVTAVTGKAVTLKILQEKANMKINGRKLDHYTPGVPVILKWPAGA